MISLAVVFVYALLYTIGFANWVQTTPTLAPILLGVTLGLSAVALIVMIALELKNYFANKPVAATATAGETTDDDKEE